MNLEDFPFDDLVEDCQVEEDLAMNIVNFDGLKMEDLFKIVKAYQQIGLLKQWVQSISAGTPTSNVPVVTIMMPTVVASMTITIGYLTIDLKEHVGDYFLIDSLRTEFGYDVCGIPLK